MHIATVSRSLKMCVALAVAFLGVGLMSALADGCSNIISIDPTQFASGPVTFTGTVTVNDCDLASPSAGETITAASITISGAAAVDNGIYTSNSDCTQGFGNCYTADYSGYGYPIYLLSLSQSGSPSTVPYMDIYFLDTASISTASLCTDAVPCGSNPTWSSQFRPSDDDAHYNTIYTPEPGSLPLVACGLLGIGFLFRKQRLATK